MAEQIAVGITGGAAPGALAGGGIPPGKVAQTEALGGSKTSEPANTKKARQQVAESTSPT